MDRITQLLGGLVALASALGGASSGGAQLRDSVFTFSGIGHAKDGDSLMVGNQEVRLFGIDAPEYSQSCTRDGVPWACGREAADELRRLVEGRNLTCTRQSIDPYDRWVARCRVGGAEANATMVERGLATAYRHYSSDYVAAEARAKAARRGLWAGSFEAPRDYRLDEHAADPERSTRRRPRGAPPPGARAGTPASSSACLIKGNHNRRGQWIYHLPGMPYYAQTRAEQVFCNEAEARAAGYRRAIVR